LRFAPLVQPVGFVDEAFDRDVARFERAGDRQRQCLLPFGFGEHRVDPLFIAAWRFQLADRRILPFTQGSHFPQNFGPFHERLWRVETKFFVAILLAGRPLLEFAADGVGAFDPLRPRERPSGDGAATA
jgi:hypothetical protein